MQFPADRLRTGRSAPRVRWCYSVPSMRPPIMLIQILAASVAEDRNRSREQRHARHRSVLESRAERPSFAARLGAAILRVARRDRHSLSNYPCRLPDGKIGRTAVVLSGGDWTLVSRVASSRLHRRTRRLTATPGSDGTRPGVRGRTCQTRPARVPARGARLRRYGQGGREPGAPPARRPDTVATASRRANGETDPPLQN
jgi:hypothetical protein